MRLLLSIAVVYDYEIEQMDVKTAFLHGDLEETIYMHQPKGFIDKRKPNHVCLLKKSIYGLKQSPRQWNLKCDDCMRKLGFKKSSYDTCLYFKCVKTDLPLYVLLYVDDILLICKSKAKIDDVKVSLKNFFDMKDLGSAHRILGVQIIRDRSKRQIMLTQHDYVKKVLDRFNIKNVKSNNIPLGGHLDLTRNKTHLTKNVVNHMKNIPYDAALGSVMYAMICSRPNLAFAISVLNRFMSEPGEKHWATMEFLLKYLSGSTNLALVYGKHNSPNELYGYVDSDYASNKDNRKSTTAYFYTWCGNCISWKAQQQPIVALSSTEAE